MRPSFMPLIVLALAACESLPKSAMTPDTVAVVRHADTMSDAAAAESAKAFNRAEAARNAPLSISVHGAEHYAADSGFRVRCVASESNGERLLQVEALGRDVRAAFTIYNPVEKEAPVGNVYARRRGRTRIGNFEVSVRTHSYTDGTGHAVITDPIGRAGSMNASNFVKMGAKKRESHRAGLSVHLRWNCE